MQYKATITVELVNRLSRAHSGLEAIKWNELYPLEAQLIESMFKTISDSSSSPSYKLVKGYEYIESFKKYYSKNGCLTDKQLTQLKRLAVEVAYNIAVVQKRTRL